LESDQGTIFRYAAHENSYLNFIHKQIMDDINNLPDGQELIEFIETITQSSGKGEVPGPVNGTWWTCLNW
jgi:hypothetical protein